MALLVEKGCNISINRKRNRVHIEREIGVCQEQWLKRSRRDNCAPSVKNKCVDNCDKSVNWCGCVCAKVCVCVLMYCGCLCE